MKVLVDGDIFSQAPGGGAVRYCNQLVNGLVACGVEVHLLVGEGARLRSVSGYPDCRIVHDAVAHGGYGIFHASYYSDRFSAPGARTVVTIHDLIDELLPRSLTECASGSGDDDAKANAIRDADHLVAISEATRNDIVRVFGVPDDRITVIHHGVPAVFDSAAGTESESRLERELHLSGPFILHVGGRDGYKNFAFLLEAYGNSRARDIAKVVAVGSQTHLLPDEERIVAQYDLNESVMLAGYVPDELLRGLYSQAALVAMPSLSEGFGYPMIEALSFGATVACSSAPALVELGAGAPLVFDPTDVDGAARILEVGLGEDHSRRRELGMRIASRFSEERMIASYIRLYERLL